MGVVIFHSRLYKMSTVVHPQEVLGKWETPIMNDACVMLFFGLLKSLVSKWLTSDSNAVSLCQSLCLFLSSSSLVPSSPLLPSSSSALPHVPLSLSSSVPAAYDFEGKQLALIDTLCSILSV